MRKGALLETLRTLVAALALGVLIWYIARNEITSEEHVEALVEVVNAEDCRVAGENGQPPRVRVVLTGPSLPLERVRDDVLREKVVGQISLTPQQRATGGDLVIPVTESIFKPLADSRVRLRLQDPRVRLVVTPLVSRRKPVSVDIPDLDPSRYRVRVLVPHEVLVRGPKPLLDRLTEVKTRPLRLADIVEAGRRDFQGNVEIAEIVDGERLECNRRGVYVDIVFGEETIEREFKSVPVLVTAKPGFPYDVRIEPDQQTATVVVRGPRSVILGPQIADQILVFLTIGALKPSTTPYLIERQYRLPEGVSLVRMSGPDKVSVDIVERTPPPAGPP